MADRRWECTIASHIEVRGDLLRYRLVFETGELPLASVTSVTYKDSFLSSTLFIHTRDGKPLEFPMDDSTKGKRVFAELKQIIEARDGAGAGSGRASGSLADEIGKLAALRDRGILTEAEFQRKKGELLG